MSCIKDVYIKMKKKMASAPRAPNVYLNG